MNFSHFFIKRPIFAGVLSVVIFMVGLIAMFRLPISEYPEVVPPQVVVRAVYPGADPKTISETIAVPGVFGSIASALYETPATGAIKATCRCRVRYAPPRRYRWRGRCRSRTGCRRRPLHCGPDGRRRGL